jgi:hypothetical protein
VIYWFGYVDVIAKESQIVLVSDRSISSAPPSPSPSCSLIFPPGFRPNGSSLDRDDDTLS